VARSAVAGQSNEKVGYYDHRRYRP